MSRKSKAALFSRAAGEKSLLACTESSLLCDMPDASRHSRAPSFRARLNYFVDNFMAKGGLSVFLALLTLFIAAFALMSALRLLGTLVFPEETAASFRDHFWRTFLQISDAGAVAEDGESNLANKVLGIATISLGLVLFSSLVAFITSQFEARLASLRKGKSAILESGHALILGFRERTVEIIRELIIANESERDAAVAILAETDKEEMDDYFRDRIEDRKSTRIITRSGSPSSIDALRKMAVASARSILILNDAISSDSREKKSAGDARVLKTIMAVIAASGEENIPAIAAELHLDRNRRLAQAIAPGKILAINEDVILARLLVQTSRTSGLSVVYSNLVGFDGCEFYFHAPEGGWGGRSAGEIQFSYPGCAVLGYRTADDRIHLNPPAEFRPADQDRAILLAEDDSAIKFQPGKVRAPERTQLPTVSAERRPERQLLSGWNVKAPLILREYNEYVAPGSEVHVVLANPDDAMREQLEELRRTAPNLGLKLIKADVHSFETLAKLRPETYDNVILLAADGGAPEEVDADSIAVLLQLRQYFRSLPPASAPVATKLITEVMDSDNIELVLQTGVRDFLISNQFVSRIMAQVSLEPEVLRIYEDLFGAEGAEAYLKSADRYFASLPVETTFAHCVAQAQARGETCLGVKLAAEEGDVDAHFGVHLIPALDRKLVLSAADELIVLAENDD